MCLGADDLQDVLTQHVLIFEIDDWDAVVTRAFEDCQPDCLEHLEVGGGVASINCMASAMVTTSEGGGNLKLGVGGADYLCHFKPIQTKHSINVTFE